MTWVRLDDGFADHPKIVELSDKAFRAHVTGLCYAGRHLTDGRLPRSFVSTIATAKVRRELIIAGLWHDASAGAVDIHDFGSFNPTRTHVEEVRRKRADAGKLGGQRSGEARREANAKQNASPGLEAKTNPDPSQTHTRTTKASQEVSSLRDVSDLRDRSRSSQRTEENLDEDPDFGPQAYANGARAEPLAAGADDDIPF